MAVNDLVQRLSVEQEIEASTRPEKSAQLLKEAFDRGYVHMKFTKTGTELGIRLDKKLTDLTSAEWDTPQGVIKVVGGLILNYNKVRYHGSVDLKTLRGKGRLEFIAETKPGDKPKVDFLSE